jgi:hypothetical protein
LLLQIETGAFYHKSMGLHLFWWLGAGLLLLAGVLVTAGFIAGPSSWLSEPFSHFWESGLLGALLLLPLMQLTLALLALIAYDCGPYANSRGELERLVELKSRGSLLQRSLRIRESAVRTRQGGPTARRSSSAGPVRTAHSEDVLDHLVYVKHSGAWAHS